MPFTQVTVTGTFDGPDPGTPAVGEVTFVLNSPMSIPGVSLIPEKRVTVALVDGAIPAGFTLYATDDPGVQPDGVSYIATVRIVGADTTQLYFNLAHTAVTFDLSAATLGAPAAATQAYATQAGLAAAQAALTAETIDREAGDTANATAIAAETARAEAAEAALANDSTVVHKALYDANTILKADTDDTPVALTVAASRIVGRKSSGSIAALTDTEVVALIQSQLDARYALAGAVSVGVIDEKVLSAATATIDFTGVPATYRHLEVIFSGRGTDSGGSSEPVNLTFNGDSSAVYDWELFSVGGTVLAGQGNLASTGVPVLLMPKGGSLAGKSSGSRILIPNYSGTTFQKPFSATGGMIYNETVSTTSFTTRQVFGLWRSTAAINRVTLTPGVSATFAAGTVVTLVATAPPGVAVNGPSVLDGGSL